MEVTTDDTLLVLGRQPTLGLAELESLYGAGNLRPVASHAALVKLMPCALDFARLGGSVKFCKILSVLATTSWDEVIKFLVRVAPEQAKKMPAGKMHLGVSALGFKITPAKINANGLTLKKAIAAHGRSVRVVPNQQSELNAASVTHNKLLTENGWELVIVKDGASTIIAQSLAVQDIASYASRDRGRPKRDARVGMLPPKLAQIIINLASGIDEISSVTISGTSKVCLSNTENEALKLKRASRIVLDPFCGTGVVLQEASLMGYEAHGSDLDARMIDFSKQNLAWLAENYQFSAPGHQLASGDATSASWQSPIDFVASETYLGRPFTSAPSAELLAKTASECNLIIKKFLANIHGQLASGTRLALAVPAWQISPGKFKHLPLIDQLGDLGYNRVDFEHVRSEQLLYYREDQIVARQILVLIRK